MPKEKEKEEEVKEWTPDQPLPDADDETEVQRRHAAQRRLKYLDEQAEKKPGKEKKPGERRSLFAVAVIVCALVLVFSYKASAETPKPSTTRDNPCCCSGFMTAQICGCAYCPLVIQRMENSSHVAVNPSRLMLIESDALRIPLAPRESGCATRADGGSGTGTNCGGGGICKPEQEVDRGTSSKR